MSDQDVPQIVMQLPHVRVPVWTVKEAPLAAFIRCCVEPLSPDRVGVVSDSNVFRHYGGALVRALTGAGYNVSTVVLEPGEKTKSLPIADEIYGCLSMAGFSRQSLLLALGGGVVGDLTGFVAGTYMRGMAYIQMPTSLLAQVDSAIGGKTGVNHPSAKNLIGLFYHPAAVWADIAWLRTLPAEEFASAFAEVLKYALVLNPELFRMIQEFDGLPLLREREDLLADMVQHCVQAKIEVVQADEREAGYRRVLNFGHSFGHALEAATTYGRFRHGEAVAWGMIMAQELARTLGIVPDDWAAASQALVRRFLDLPRLADLSAEDLCPFLRRDKKNTGGNCFFVFSPAPGKYRFEAAVDFERVQQVVRGFVDDTQP